MATESAFSACRAPIGHLAASAAAARSESVRQRIAARRRRRAHKTASLATRWQGWKLPDAPLLTVVTVTPIGLFWVQTLRLIDFLRFQSH